MATVQLRLRVVPVEALEPAPYNPRVALRPGMPGYEKLKRSLEEFDLVQPLVWNERTGHVVSGHQRLTILREQGVDRLEVAVVDLPLEREKALNVALNNARVGGEWDAGKLIGVLDELRGLPEIDETLTGFDADELQSLLLGPADGDDDDDEPEESDAYQVTFEVPADEWEALRPELDGLLARFDVRAHVRPPRG